MRTKYSLIVNTGSYTGNTDCTLLALLFGIDDGRAGGAEGLEKHIELFGENNPMFEDVIEHRPTDEYGYQPYTIYDDDDGYNSLEIYLGYIENLSDLLTAWREKIGSKVQILNWKRDGTFTIKIKGYKLLTRTTSEELKEL